jgi:hypothetical protein
MGGGGGGKGGSVKQAKVEAPQVQNVAPPPATVAEAPIVNEQTRDFTQTQNKRKGASALRIDLNLGGSGGSGGGRTGSGLVIPS